MASDKSILKTLLVNLLVFALLMIFLEGLLGWAFVIKDILAYEPLAERRHSRFDANLGWTAAANVDIPDMYGPGKFVKTNALGFRSSSETTPRAPEGMRRAVCSGDSFTFGYGVSNDETWCHDLSELVTGLETVNLGMGGYGIDQSYLLYQSVSSTLEHDVQLFAVIHDDFMRIEKKSFFGYGKPKLELRSGKLEVTNVPVEEAKFKSADLYQRFAPLGRLRIARFVRNLGAALSPSAKGEYPIFKEPGSVELALAIYAELQRINREAGRSFVSIYLPIMDDYEPNEADSWRARLSNELKARGILHLDLIDDLRALPADEIQKLYISEEASAKYRNASLHYTAEGNLFVARILRERLKEALKGSRTDLSA